MPQGTGQAWKVFELREVLTVFYVPWRMGSQGSGWCWALGPPAVHWGPGPLLGTANSEGYGTDVGKVASGEGQGSWPSRRGTSHTQVSVASCAGVQVHWSKAPSEESHLGMVLSSRA